MKLAKIYRAAQLRLFPGDKNRLGHKFGRTKGGVRRCIFFGMRRDRIQ